MKKLLVLFFVLYSINLIADIPRADIIKVLYKGEIHYTYDFIAHLEFKEGCVFDKYKKEYLYETGEYFEKRFNDNNQVTLYSEIILIPISILYPRKSRMYKYNPTANLFSLNGEKQIIPSAETSSVSFMKRIIGTSTGQFITDLNKQDRSWIYDYPLERIASLNDYDICQLELFSIKNNVTKFESDQIKDELNRMYKLRNAPYRNNKGNEIEEYISYLWNRNILVIGYCSC